MISFDDKSFAAVMFDMDGTLTDTEPVGVITLRKWSKLSGVTLTAEEEKLFDNVWRRVETNMTVEAFIEQVLLKRNCSQLLETGASDFLRMYKEDIARAPSLPGALSILKRIHGHVPMALVTASRAEQAHTLLQAHKWTEMFDVVLCADQYKAHKPSPASYMMAARALHVTPSKCLVVEDSENGVKSAKSAGAYVIGVRAGNMTIQDLSAADEVVDSLFDIVTRITGCPGHC